jgi:Fe-S cluster biogenesis protein NfuA
VTTTETDDATRAVATVDSVAAGLTAVRQRLRGHAGDLRVAGVHDGSVEIEFLGACNGCPALGFTFSAVVVPTVEALAGVTSVQSRQVRYSRFIAERLRATHPGPDEAPGPRDKGEAHVR